LAKLSKLELVADPLSTEHAHFISAHLPMGDEYVPLAGLIDLDKETNRLNSEIADVERELARSQGKLSNEQFLTRAPAEVVEGERQRLAGFTEELAAVEKLLADL